MTNLRENLIKILFTHTHIGNGIKEKDEFGITVAKNCVN